MVVDTIIENDEDDLTLYDVVVLEELQRKK